ncbi:hypothetical protein SAMN05660649_01816 [Desulfotomaculum arcticum]|uniref:Uncharacterized protein n=1 Tax=Desulfotruncus arcticus DSM 17038 TaxID=1121424 RepID=A0A1I2S8B6_9FIRM|nr:hypothetical protein SAMN05660649_01816 [Desulfotomaculum arcticum] [Desulfotruncus arcticus DSM 17038]
MERSNDNKTDWKINFSTVGRKYYVFSENSGMPSADFYIRSKKSAGGLIVPHKMDSSADLKPEI